MPRSGGTYTPPTNSWSPAVNGTLAVTADWNAVLNDLVAALTQSVSKDGQTAMTGPLDMGGNAVTNAATAAPGTNTGQVATTAFVSAASFASALPAQSGNEGKVVTTDGSTASWTDEISLSSLNSGQLAGLRNKIINGKMEIAQRGTVFNSAASAAYTLDRWQLGGAGTDAVINVTQAGGDGTFNSSLSVAVSMADASIAAGQSLNVSHKVEGFNVRELVGVPITLSFLVFSTKTGVHCVSLGNSGTDRSYVVEYVVNASNTWEAKTITIPAGLITAGTWNFTGGVGVSVRWTLAAGSSFQTTANAWQTGNFLATANQVNCLDTIGNIFAITGVQLEVGSVATPFEHRPYGMELALCQRYYTRQTPTAADQTLGVGHNTSTTAAVATATFPMQMRSAPSALEQSGTAGDYSVAYAATSTVCSAVPTFLTASPFAATTTFTVASGLTAGQGSRARAVNTSAYLAWSAEL